MEKIKDLVCGMEIDKDESAASYDYQGKTFHFCSEGCRNEFTNSPGVYIK